jgi:hypothetical protein
MAVFQKLGIPRSHIAIVKSRDIMKRIACRKNNLVALGDDCQYWIIYTNKYAKRLENAGYEVFNWNYL